ncbi:hypothetical protein [Glaciibacter sp. 2TAF33]|uniref:hypothetical protein n=1 Tax=Glaciibacter sp. 2TAF33 TaxID=3233015 RepID=UPI003F92A6B7
MLHELKEMSTMAPIHPQDVAEAAAAASVDPSDPAENFFGYAVMGVPFESGHYLAFRHFPASSIGPGYRAVWLREPDGVWTIFADAPPDVSCMRYVGTGITHSVTGPVELHWLSPTSARIEVPDAVDWRIDMGNTPATRVAGITARLIPAPLWQSDAFLAVMGAMMGPMLRAGRMRLAGRVPNGQTYRMRPLRVWALADSAATVFGRDAGRPRGLPEQEHLADLWLPQRGLFVADVVARYPSTAGRGDVTDQVRTVSTTLPGSRWGS